LIGVGAYHGTKLDVWGSFRPKKYEYWLQNLGMQPPQHSPSAENAVVQKICMTGA
jgi:hypothetical protein